jgi:magnesium chelatase subunit D
VLLVVLASCGGGSGRGISDAAAGPLADRVAAVREAAAAGPDQARLQLAALREEVTSYAAAGDLSDDAVERILAAVEEVEAGLAPAAPPAETTTTTATPPPPPPPPPPPDEEAEQEEDETGEEEQDEDEKADEEEEADEKADDGERNGKGKGRDG